MDLRAEKSERMRQVQGQISMAVDSGGTSGARVVEAKHLSKRFGDKVLLSDFSTRIVRGDRIAIVGPNGAGKTTLLKVLLGQIPADSGTVKLGTNLEISYVDQARANLKPEMTLWDVMAPAGGDQILVHGRPKHVAAYAKDFLFKDSQLRQPVESLSGGERNRLLLALALASPANLMVLDEPTNDLDMDTLDLLEELLADYDGTLLLVSHDRDFIDRLATSTIALDGRGRTVETPGGWQDFTRQNPGFFAGAFDAAHQAVSKAKAAPVRSAAPVAAPPAAKAKLTFKDAHRLKELEALVPKLTDTIKALETQLDDPGLFARDRAAFDKLMAQLDRKRLELAAGEEEWLKLEEKRESLG
jgi:ATP-binding cassette subfamily F protein uup